MKTMYLGGWWMIVLMLSPLASHAQDAKSAETFVRELYQRYQTDKDFAPFGDFSSVKKLATPSLAALAKRDFETSAAAQDASGLDFDPVSGSQDSEGLKVAELKVESTTPDHALAEVTLLFQDEKVKRRLLLLAVKNEWRIDNITDGDGHADLRAILTRSIAAHQSRRKH